MTASPVDRMSSCRQLGWAAVAALIGIIAVEAINSARVYHQPQNERPFPQGYVSRGVWSLYGLVRPLDSTSTDIAPTIRVAQAVLHGHHDLYADFDPRGSSFIYPPTTTIALLPLGWVADHFGLPRAVQTMDLLGRLGALGIVIIVLAFVRPLLVRPRDWVLAVVLLLAFFPMRWSLVCVQAQSLINIFLAGALLAYACARYGTAGVLVGLACCLKPQFAALVVFVVARRRWRLLTTMLVTVALFVLVSVLVVGIGAWRTYLVDVAPVIANGYAWSDNRSFNGLARRWFGDPRTFGVVAASQAVRVWTLVTSALLVAVSALPRGRTLRVSTPYAATRVPPLEQPSVGSLRGWMPAADLGIALLALAMASPIAWNHHYGWVMVLFAITAALQVADQPGRMAWAGLVISYVFCGVSWLAWTSRATGPITLVDSAPLFAAILLLGLAWRAVRRLALTTAIAMSPAPAVPSAPDETGDAARKG